MNALVLPAIGQPLEWQNNYPDPVPARGEVVVDVKAAALNSRDVWISKGQYAGIKLPCILGSDGAGLLDGHPVLINPSMKWGRNAHVQGPDYEILGMPRNGTFAQRVAVPRRQVYTMPEHLSFEQAAAFPLAGLTAWRALVTRCRVRAGEKVFITGIGGGVALMAMQIALAKGATVWVSSGSEAKINRATSLGAAGGVNYKDPDWAKQVKSVAGGFDVVIDSGGGDGFASLPGICNPGARIGIYGGTAGKINGLSPQILFWKQISILGSTMGHQSEFAAMLRFVVQHRIVPVVDSVRPMSEGQSAFDWMDSGAQFGKVVMM
ncbi:MAG: zinc-binding dehydrogenase [Saprospiraceae bacterium]